MDIDSVCIITTFFHTSQIFPNNDAIRRNASRVSLRCVTLRPVYFSYHKLVWRRLYRKYLWNSAGWPALLWRHGFPSSSLSFPSVVYLHFPCALRKVMQYALASLSKEITKGRVAFALAFTHHHPEFIEARKQKTCKETEWEIERYVSGSSRNQQSAVAVTCHFHHARSD